MSQLRKTNSDSRIVAETLALAKVKGMTPDDAIALTGLSRGEIQTLLNDPAFKQDLEKATAQLRLKGADSMAEVEAQAKRVIKQISTRIDDADASTSDVVRMGELLIKMMALLDRRDEVAANRDAGKQVGKALPSINIYLGDSNEPTHSIKPINSTIVDALEVNYE